MSERWMGLAQAPSAQLVGVGKDPTLLRSRLERKGVSLARCTLFKGDPLELELPPYFARLIVVDASADIAWTPGFLSGLYSMLRPYGASLCVAGSKQERAVFRSVVAAAELPGPRLSEHDGFSRLQRSGPLPGATNYLGDWAKSPDERVRFPLGVLWFDDALGHFKRSPQPKFVDGVMVSTTKKWVVDKDERVAGKIDYRLTPAVLSDVYTGRVMGSDEETEIRKKHGKVDLKTLQPSQYRPPKQLNDWAPKKPSPGERINPLTGEKEPRTFPKSYGCDGGLDYGYVYTMRSATAAYYDKRIESGTINLSGPRSGCTNTIIPANGLLNVPYYFEGCSCSYPLPMALALVSMPQTHEQWTAWGTLNPERLQGKVRRLGLNFGAPGDRVTEAGTLWLDIPSVGGPSPSLPVKVQPEEPRYRYHHSLRVRGGTGWPWVAASCAEGLDAVRVRGLVPGRYVLRLSFLEPDRVKAGERVFDVFVQGRKVLEEYDVTRSAGGAMRAVVETVRGVVVEDVLVLRLRSIKGRSLLSGMELIREDLPVPAPIVLAEKDVWAVEESRP
jgi:hypothetical protein